ncbi:OmpA family protein [Thermaurantimonas sp.]|uniref:OmpA family protein n=1 Tax=Thermaurantimonas sp. TaxID=2681568 RepID=UPI003918B013
MIFFKYNLFAAFVVVTGVQFFSKLYAQPELGTCEKPCAEKAVAQIEKWNKAWRAKNYQEMRRYADLMMNFDRNCPHVLYLYGETAVRGGRMREAEAAWMRLLELCPDYKADVLFYAGVVLIENGQPSKGVELLKKYIQHPDREPQFDREARSILNSLDMERRLRENPVDFHPKPLEDICTAADEYLATISPDGSWCFFTRRGKEIDRKSGPVPVERVVEKFSYARRLPDGKFERGQPLPSPFNQKYNEGGPSITADNRELYFTICELLPSGYQNCDIYISTYSNDRWSEPQSVGELINRPDSWESQPSVTANGDWLYFASNRKGGQGGLDLYRCYRLPDGRWSAPENLGPTVNTSKDEKSPYIHSDGVTLYFSSNGHGGIGGHDIFYTQLDLQTQKWSAPQNIGYPINTEADEVGLFVSLDGTKGYISTDKIKGKGGWDVFYFELPKSARPNFTRLITGRLTDENGQSPGNVQVKIKKVQSAQETTVRIDTVTGDFAVALQTQQNEDLLLVAEKAGTAFTSRYIVAEDLNASQESVIKQQTIEVKKLKRGEEYRLHDINFETNSYALDKRAVRILEEFYEFLKTNKSIHIEIQGHTDNVGTREDNLVLSNNRAKVVYEYLLNKGISPSRMSYKGFGPDKPIASNQTEQGRALNRRTVFVIKDF